MKRNMIMTIDPTWCPQNHSCPAVRICPAGALSQQGYNAPEVDTEKCTGCGVCTRVCFARVFQLREASVAAG